MSALQIDPAIDVAIRGGLALLFAAAALHKLRDLTRFRAIVVAYEVLPSTLVSAAAPLVAACEAALAVGLLFPADTSRTVWALAAAAMFALYAVAIAVNLYRGRRDIDCGCGFGTASEKIGPALLVRNAFLVTVALWASAPRAARSLVALDAFTVFAALAGSALLYAASEKLRGLPSSGRGETP